MNILLAHKLKKRKRRKFIEKFKKNLVIAALIAAVAFGFYLSQAQRLSAYDSWYMCEIYGKQTYCTK